MGPFVFDLADDDTEQMSDEDAISNGTGMAGNNAGEEENDMVQCLNCCRAGAAEDVETFDGTTRHEEHLTLHICAVDTKTVRRFKWCMLRTPDLVDEFVPLCSQCEKVCCSAVHKDNPIHCWPAHI